VLWLGCILFFSGIVRSGSANACERSDQSQTCRESCVGVPASETVSCCLCSVHLNTKVSMPGHIFVASLLSKAVAAYGSRLEIGADHDPAHRSYFLYLCNDRAELPERGTAGSGALS
jgi:hypothetical protein